jgi:hypothetical protein
MQDANGNFFGDVLFDFMDAQIQTILQLLDLSDDTLPIFVTDGVTNQALGYHNAAQITDSDGTAHLQTYIFTSWLDPAEVAPIVADVSTFNHELAEWTQRSDCCLWRQPVSRGRRSTGQRAELCRLPPGERSTRGRDVSPAAVGAMAVVHGYETLERLRRLVHVPNTPGPHCSSRLLPLAFTKDGERRTAFDSTSGPRLSLCTSKLDTAWSEYTRC